MPFRIILVLKENTSPSSAFLEILGIESLQSSVTDVQCVCVCVIMQAPPPPFYWPLEPERLCSARQFQFHLLPSVSSHPSWGPVFSTLCQEAEQQWNWDTAVQPYTQLFFSFEALINSILFVRDQEWRDAGADMISDRLLEAYHHDECVKGGLE